MTGGLSYPTTYSWSTTVPVARKVTTSRKELFQIGGAFVVLTLDFVLIFSGSGLLGSGQAAYGFSLLELVLVAALTALTAFLAHELAHKVTAQRAGSWAEFRWSISGLAFSIFTAFLGFLFAAPGATVVGGMSDPDQWGRTALAGPAVNFVFGAAFYAGSVFAWYDGSSWFVVFLVLAFYNSWFGTFNLIPAGPLDGAKVLRWTKGGWAVAIVATGALTVLCGLALFYYGTPVLHA
ncbi:MAG: metalloprotease [Thermoplasmata archaeon]